MHNRHELRFIILLFVLILTSFSWPQQNIRITSTFGESRGDHIHDGIDIISPSNTIYPVDDGILLYAWNRSLFPFENYTGSGNYSVIDHGKYASTYLHLEDSPVLQQRYSQKEPLGRYANSGRSYGNHLHFGWYDRNNWSSHNFLNFVDAIPDENPPVINHIAFSINSSIVRVTDNSSIRLTEHHPVLFNIFDNIHDGYNVGIHQLTVYLNGSQIHSVTFDEALYDKNGLTISGKTLENIFEGKDYYKVNELKYANGVNTFKVIASDYAGNVTEKEFTLTIRLDL
ncbi:MAG: M23 family metallopeptidase [Spirochaetes bacterium]|jgi:murein DD-endopeptidase MepM/ murein hydrolase activator NlpD|nr:M23 family metallopeptidase [Spirochaetota bacterium]